MQCSEKYRNGAIHNSGNKGIAIVPILGIDDERSIKATFYNTLDGKCLTKQLICKSKANHSLSKAEWPSDSWLSVNKKHHSNKTEALKLLEDFVLPYFAKEPKNLG